MNRRPLVRRARRRLFPLQFEAMESRLLLATFFVTSTADSGLGTLRQAILDVDADSTPGDTIDFSIGSGGFQIISPLSALPEITNSVTIDGTSQPGYTYYPLIEIDGVFAGFGVDGLTISAGSSTVQGLDIVRFSGNGIDLNSHGDDVIDSCIIGTDFGGDPDLGNSGSGVMIDDVPGNMIGTSLATSNVLSGNNGAGLTIFGSVATGNLVLDNYIGTNYVGSKAVPNGIGVAITEAPGNVIGTSLATGNILSGNNGAGLVISGSVATGNLVEGNLIGTDASGAQAVPNIGDGVFLASPNNTIGGTAPGAGNVISANGLDGILIASNSAGNLVEGNLIGTDVSGTQTIPNLGNGVEISGSVANTIGGTTPGASNLISGNDDGVLIINASSQ